MHNCQQDCSNTEGLYVCSCSPGYELADDKMSCTGMNGIQSCMICACNLANEVACLKQQFYSEMKYVYYI